MNDQHYDEVAFCEYLDGSLPKSEIAAFERHLAGCEACRAMVEEARLAQEGLKGLQLRAGPDLAPRIMAAVRKLPVPVAGSPETPEEQAGSRRFIGWLSLVASAALAVALFVSLPRTTPGGSGVSRTLPVETGSASKAEFAVAIDAAEGGWHASTQLVNGIYREATTFTTDTDGFLVLTDGPDSRIELHPGSRATIDGERLQVEHGAVRCEIRNRGPGQVRVLKAGTVSAGITDASFGVRVAPGTCSIDLFEGNLAVTIASEPPVILTPGNRAVCVDRISLETLGEEAKQAWMRPSHRAATLATPAAPVSEATPPVVIELPVEPMPASAPTEPGRPVQGASATASPPVVPDDPLSALQNHQP